MSLLDRLPARIVMIADLPIIGEAPSSESTYRTVTPDDLPALAELLVVAYAGTVDDLNESPEEALDYLHKRTRGEIVGPMLWDCSFVAVQRIAPVAAVLTSEENPGKPLLGDVYTHPDWQRRGLATALIHLTANALHERGYKEMTLKVAIANTDARRLYERLGFRSQ